MKQRSASEIFVVFLRLGCTSFGGPVAHLGYYREELVRRRQWLDEALFAEIVGFCQMIPGPGSSQTGFTIGLVTGGWRGAVAAWTAFTAPSALLMLAFALSQHALSGTVAQRAIHGLQLVAVAVVAQAVLGMRRVLAPDRTRGFIAILAATLVLLTNHPGSQIAAIALGGLAGYLLFRGRGAPQPGELSVAIPRWVGVAALLVFVLLLFAPLRVFGAFYRTGALVFGGGHVVLPLLESVTVAKGLVDEKTFLAGYGAAQAIPGPMFTFAAYLGAVLKQPPNGVAGGLLALCALFLPGLLLVVGLLPFWAALRRQEWLRSSLAGVNASVVGILAAALYRPVWTGSVHSLQDILVVFLTFVALSAAKLPPWIVAPGVAMVSLALK
jgi:chromate transporter